MDGGYQLREARLSLAEMAHLLLGETANEVPMSVAAGGKAAESA